MVDSVNSARKAKCNQMIIFFDDTPFVSVIIITFAMCCKPSDELNAHIMNKKLGLGILSLFSLCGLAQTQRGCGQ